MRRVFASLFVLSSLCVAADLAGTWQIAPPAGRNGVRRISTYVFKVDGDKFSGKFGSLTETRDVLNGVIVDPTHITFDTHFEFYAADRVDHFKGEITDDG